MTKFIATLALLLALATPAFAGAPAFPFATMHDAAKTQAAPTELACAGAAFKVDLGPEWNVWSDGFRAVFVHYTVDASVADYVYVTSIVTIEPYTLVVQEALSIVDAKEKYPSPCAVFSEKATL